MDGAAEEGGCDVLRPRNGPLKCRAADGVALIVGERKRPAMRALLEALPADQVRALDYDMERVVLAEPPPPPENFGIAVLAYAPSRAALDGLLGRLEAEAPSS